MSLFKDFNCTIYGDETLPKLVFLHGLYGSASNWLPTVNFLKEHFCILTYDQRGHGQAIKPQSGYGPNNFAQDLYDILNEINWPKVNLVGHSMGGRNSIVFASLHPDYIERLIIEDIGIPKTKPLDKNYQEYLLEIIPTPFNTRSEAREFFTTTFIEKIKDNPKAKQISQFLYTNIAKNESGHYDWRFSKDAIREIINEGLKLDWITLWKNIQCPTLILRGSDSDYLSESILNTMLETNPNATAQLVQNAGHWIHYEQKEVFVKSILTFLSQS